MSRSLITGLFVLLGCASLWAQGTGFNQNLGGGINTSQFNSGGGRGNTGFGGGAQPFSGGTTAQPDFEYSDRAGSFIGANVSADQGRFVGMGPQTSGPGAQNFGAQSFGVQNRGGFGGQNRGAFGNLGGFGARGQQRGLQGRGQPQGRNTSTRVVRTRISVGFDYQAVPFSAVKTSLESTLNRLGELGKSTFRGSDISVIPRGRSVVLQGQVASARDRDLAARIARFEPGVSAVINELVVMDAAR